MKDIAVNGYSIFDFFEIISWAAYIKLAYLSLSVDLNCRASDQIMGAMIFHHFKNHQKDTENKLLLQQILNWLPLMALMM